MMRPVKLVVTAMVILLLASGCSWIMEEPNPTVPPGTQPAPGAIWFGHSLAGGDLMSSHADTLSAATPIGWLANFSRLPTAASVTLTIEPVGTDGTAVGTFSQTIELVNPQNPIYGYPPDTFLAQNFAPGTYTVKYDDSKGTIATGTVTITK